MDKFPNDMHQVKKHVFIIIYQFRVYRTLRETMPPDSYMIHGDFSENFVGKYASEMQAVHFGGSQQQMTLHSGVLYLNNQTVPFCTISPSTQHDPPAIWAHLTPILQFFRSHVDVKTLHVFTDYPIQAEWELLLHVNKPFDFGFHTISWHFFESGHGNGAPDVIGGALKRTADRQVKLERIYRRPKCCMMFCRKQHPFNCFTSEQRKLQTNKSEMSALKLATLKGH